MAQPPKQGQLEAVCQHLSGCDAETAASYVCVWEAESQGQSHTVCVWESGLPLMPQSSRVVAAAGWRQRASRLRTWQPPGCQGPLQTR